MHSDVIQIDALCFSLKRSTIIMNVLINCVSNQNSHLKFTNLETPEDWDAKRLLGWRLQIFLNTYVSMQLAIQHCFVLVW